MPGCMSWLMKVTFAKRHLKKETLTIVNVYEHFKTVDLKIFAEFQMMLIWKTGRDKLENHNKNVYACILLALQNILFNGALLEFIIRSHYLAIIVMFCKVASAVFCFGFHRMIMFHIPGTSILPSLAFKAFYSNKTCYNNDNFTIFCAVF